MTYIKRMYWGLYGFIAGKNELTKFSRGFIHFFIIVFVIFFWLLLSLVRWYFTIIDHGLIYFLKDAPMDLFMILLHVLLIKLLIKIAHIKFD